MSAGKTPPGVDLLSSFLTGSLVGVLRKQPLL